MTDEIILWDYYRSSASYRVRIALNLAGVHYTKMPIDLLAAEHVLELRQKYHKIKPQQSNHKQQSLTSNLAVDLAQLCLR